MDEEQPDAPQGDPDTLGTGEDEVDVQQLLSAANRAIAAVRRQAVGLLGHHRDVNGDKDDEQAEERRSDPCD